MDDTLNHRNEKLVDSYFNGLFILLKAIYLNKPISSLMYTVEGGELVGTSTVTTKVASRLSIKRETEPSKTGYKYIKKIFEEKEDDNTPENIKYLTKLFMKDRNKLYKRINKGDKKVVVDRGLISTIIYQSGILNPEITPEDFKRNCEFIYEYAMDLCIMIPHHTFIIGMDIDENLDDTEYIMNCGIEMGKRAQARGTGEDPMSMVMIARVYAGLMEKVAVDEVLSKMITHVTFTDSLDSIVKKVCDKINEK